MLILKKLFEKLNIEIDVYEKVEKFRNRPTADG